MSTKVLRSLLKPVGILLNKIPFFFARTQTVITYTFRMLFEILNFFFSVIQSSARVTKNRKNNARASAVLSGKILYHYFLDNTNADCYET